MKNTDVDFKSVQLQKSSGCGCDSGCCDNPSDSKDTSQIRESEPAEINITIDGKPISVFDKTKNLVEIAKEAGIAIPAPCYLAKKKDGCCKSCVVEVNSKHSLACATKAKEGMDVVVNRADLISLRKDRLLRYKESVQHSRFCIK